MAVVMRSERTRAPAGYARAVATSVASHPPFATLRRTPGGSIGLPSGALINARACSRDQRPHCGERQGYGSQSEVQGCRGNPSCVLGRGVREVVCGLGRRRARECALREVHAERSTRDARRQPAGRGSVPTGPVFLRRLHTGGSADDVSTRVEIHQGPGPMSLSVSRHTSRGQCGEENRGMTGSGRRLSTEPDKWCASANCPKYESSTHRPYVGGPGPVVSSLRTDELSGAARRDERAAMRLSVGARMIPEPTGSALRGSEVVVAGGYGGPRHTGPSAGAGPAAARETGPI